MGRVYFPTRNDNGVRDLSKSITLGGYLYTDYRGPAEPAAKAAMNPVTLGNLGAPLREYFSNVYNQLPSTQPSVAPPTPAPPTVMSRVAPGPLKTLAPPVSSQSSPTPQVTVPPAAPPTSVYVSSGGGTASPSFGINRSSAAQVAGTPVPIGFPIDSVFINPSDGSQWEYSSSQGAWISVGTPYNLAAPSAAPASLPAVPTAAPIAATASTATQVYGTPVPIGYPTTSPYIDSSGNTWQFSGATNTWTVSALASTTAASPTTSTVVTAAPGLTDQVASWLSGTTPIMSYNVPNALLAAGVALGVALLMGGGKKR